MCVCMLSHVWLFVTSQNVAHQALLSMGFSTQGYTGVGCHILLWRIFPTQGLNPGLLHLLHWHADSLPLSHLGKASIFKPLQLICWVWHIFLFRILIQQGSISREELTTNNIIRTGSREGKHDIVGKKTNTKIVVHNIALLNHLYYTSSE